VLAGSSSTTSLLWRCASSVPVEHLARAVSCCLERGRSHPCRRVCDHSSAVPLKGCNSPAELQQPSSAAPAGRGRSRCGRWYRPRALLLRFHRRLVAWRERGRLWRVCGRRWHACIPRGATVSLYAQRSLARRASGIAAAAATPPLSHAARSGAAGCADPAVSRVRRITAQVHMLAL